MTATTAEIDAKSLQELEEKFDPEMRFRPTVPPATVIVKVLLITLSLFHYYTAGFGLLRETTHRGVHLAFVLSPDLPGVRGFSASAALRSREPKSTWLTRQAASPCYDLDHRHRAGRCLGAVHPVYLRRPGVPRGQPPAASTSSWGLDPAGRPVLEATRPQRWAGRCPSLPWYSWPMRIVRSDISPACCKHAGNNWSQTRQPHVPDQPGRVRRGGGRGGDLRVPLRACLACWPPVSVWGSCFLTWPPPSPAATPAAPRRSVGVRLGHVRHAVRARRWPMR